MIDVSVIIVNYNVRYFIEQAIQSVYKAANNLEVEIIVIDNASDDQSIELIAKKFPRVKLIANAENRGFGKANNQGIELAQGEYTLLLNPDTVLQEDTLDICISFIRKNKDAGALGVRMIDGKGNFLPESKRSIPSPFVAFSKMSGLANLFPKSKTFGRYHLGFLDESKNHAVEVLSGAFMFFKTPLLKDIGGFDEDYFMYGEDIELSFQVIKKGFKNYYLADTSIIHYKGESTKKGSLNYVKVFYEAMLIFAKKHFTSQEIIFYTWGIKLAIYLRGGVSLISGLLKKLGLPFIDALLSIGFTVFITKLWALKIKETIDYYPVEFFTVVIPLYAFVWILMHIIIGSYEKPYQSKKIWRGALLGTLLIAAIYGFLPENLRFSRAIIILGGVGSAFILSLTRLLYHLIFHRKARIELKDKGQVIIIGNEEAERAFSLLKNSQANVECIGFVSFDKEYLEELYLGEYKSLADIVSLYHIDELIFCGKDIPSLKIISSMAELGNSLNYKIMPDESVSIIGSNSRNSAGDLYAIDVNLKISTARSKWIKRIFDITFASFLLLAFPLAVLLMENKRNFFSNILKVLTGKLSWVGYLQGQLDSVDLKLPSIKPGVLTPMSNSKKKKGLTGSRLNLLYAKNYSIETDITLALKNFSFLGEAVD
ncbi:glycosyltransferase family 2 protein [Chitinophagales bacterium]|nr:glycosyltransferase family 2 protein [Chitinophagales bacterium]